MLIKNYNRKKVDPVVPVHTGVKYLEFTKSQLFKYNADNYSEEGEFDLNRFKAFSADENTYWLNIHGIHDVGIINKICQKLKVHNLVVQDILDVNQRSKFQEFENYWFFSIKSILFNEDSDMFSEQISFILGSNYLLSFQERIADYFDHVRERIRTKKGIIRDRGVDYLLFVLLESILDNYFKTVSNIETQIEKIAAFSIDADPSPESLRKIESLKRQVHLIKKAIIPIREFVNRLEREDFLFIQETHKKYYFELKDMCLTLLDDCDKIDFRLESSTNLFFSIQGHRMNQVMKILTVVATIFIPLTFVAGIYGMNFSNMPELNWEWGYFMFWGLITVIFIFMLAYFRKKKWF